MSLDKKALQILLKSGGWRPVDSEEYDYARQKNYMFDPVRLTHDQIVQRLLHARRRITLQRVSDAFVASLSTRRLELRSALGSFAYAANFPAHQMASSPSSVAPSGNVYCEVCGTYDEGSEGSLDPEELSVLNYQRFKWGGVGHLDPLYAAFDLELFEQAEHLTPTEDDYRILSNIIEVAKLLPADSKPGHLSKAISKVFPSNEAERRTLVEILAICGVLAPVGRPGFLQTFATADHVNRDRPADHKNDWRYPAIWWRGVDKVNVQALNLCFPGLSVREY